MVTQGQLKLVKQLLFFFRLQQHVYWDILYSIEDFALNLQYWENFILRNYFKWLRNNSVVSHIFGNWALFVAFSWLELWWNLYVYCIFLTFFTRNFIRAWRYEGLKNWLFLNSLYKRIHTQFQIIQNVQRYTITPLRHSHILL